MLQGWGLGLAEITPNNCWGFNKRNFQGNYTSLRRPSWERAHHRLHQNILRELIGVMNFTSVTPENSRGINCVIQMGPMVITKILAPMKIKSALPPPPQEKKPKYHPP